MNHEQWPSPVCPLGVTHSSQLLGQPVHSWAWHLDDRITRRNSPPLRWPATADQSCGGLASLHASPGDGNSKQKPLAKHRKTPAISLCDLRQLLPSHSPSHPLQNGGTPQGSSALLQSPSHKQQHLTNFPESVWGPAFRKLYKYPSGKQKSNIKTPLLVF